MRTPARWLSLALLLCAGSCAAQPPYERSRDVVYRMETGVGQCTATAVGPHTLLTAEHCGVSSPGRVLLDGVPADVESITLDGRDHALVRVSLTFKRWAGVGDAPRRGDAVYLIGDPEGLRDVLRLGYYCGRADAHSPEASAKSETDLYDIGAGHGDSGAAMFNARGRIIGVLTGGYTPTADFRLIRVIPLAFTPEQWAQAAK